VRYQITLVWILVATLVAGCARRTGPIVDGADLYAQVAEVRGVTVRREQVLVTERVDGLIFLVGDAGLAARTSLLLRDEAPQRQPTAVVPRNVPTALVALTLVGSAISGLSYGIATCEFEGCKAVFGLGLVLIGGAALFALVGGR
jgi:hypothetical protein